MDMLGAAGLGHTSSGLGHTSLHELGLDVHHHSEVHNDLRQVLVAP